MPKVQKVQKKTNSALGSSRRITVSIDAERFSILDSARPQDGSMSDAVRAVIDIAARADDIDHENRRLADALTVAMGEMVATLREIRAGVARLERSA